ncbi:helix-turn-helix domain-containing protein [Limibacter armeniacum]|uniref:helix-turn-helix domain-containing protein n=1 Tax=Limibacter armeniacum TaxID=466084 RepID=UPI002FE632F9
MQQLTLHSRLQIEAMLHSGASQSAIARALGVHRSTVSREISRNSVEGKYFADVAAQKALVRKQMGANLMKLTKLFSVPKVKGASRKGNRKSRLSFYFYPKYLRYHRKGRFFRRAKDQRDRIRHCRYLHWEDLVEMRSRNGRRIREFAWEWYRSRFARKWKSWQYQIWSKLQRYKMAKSVAETKTEGTSTALLVAWSLSQVYFFWFVVKANAVSEMEGKWSLPQVNSPPSLPLVCPLAFFVKKIFPFHARNFLPVIFPFRISTCFSFYNLKPQLFSVLLRLHRWCGNIPCLIYWLIFQTFLGTKKISS